MQYVNRKKSLSLAEKEQHDLERQQYNEALRLKNNRFGIALFQLSWIMVFVSLIIVYWQMGYQPGWRPTAEQAPHVLMPTLATIALILSGWLRPPSPSKKHCRIQRIPMQQRRSNRRFFEIGY
ncbi:MAG: hypothetical protein Q9P01_07185 [Anaerolineae bacterium]|nr:hypothetical protein [Anaerolineae bacterium]